MQPRTQSLPSPTPPQHAMGALRYARIRERTVQLLDGLEHEDLVAQSMPDASPTKWHLAHTTWFFEAFVLEPAGFEPLNATWLPLLNSYYESYGPRHPRAERGLLTRPTVTQVLDYRRRVDERMHALLAGGASSEVIARIELGLQHEQQHQELIVTDMTHLLFRNPLAPAWRTRRAPRVAVRANPALSFLRREEGRSMIGATPDGFAFDHERPRHATWLAPHALASRPVTNAEFATFVDGGGYDDPALWLSDAWTQLKSEQWRSPLYWRRANGGWEQFSVYGHEPLDPAEPVCHISYYEADAFARWAGMRLPTEAEWENLAADREWNGEFADTDTLHPRALGGQSFGGNVWEWTSSAYLPYPGFRPLEGAAGEYNGKFMSGQMVLRGGSCATPREHARPSYRNFFPPHARWQFSGVRLARDIA